MAEILEAAFERIDRGRGELPAALSDDLIAGLLDRPSLFVAAAADQGIEDVRDRGDLRLDSFIKKTREGKIIAGYGGIEKYYR